jgi:hypothetical protein
MMIDPVEQYSSVGLRLHARVLFIAKHVGMRNSSLRKFVSSQDLLKRFVDLPFLHEFLC